MRKKLNQILSMLIFLNFYCGSLFASCGLNEQQKINPICNENTDTDLTTIDAINFTTIKAGLLNIGGGVCINMNGQQIFTDNLLYDDEKQIVTIETPMTYSDSNQTVQASGAIVDLQLQKAQMSEVYYHLEESQANGKASRLSTDKKISNLTGLTYSTCPQDNQQWFIKAQSAELDQEKQVGTFRKMSLNFKGISILYLPYAKMPLNDQRLSGFLIPEIGNSSTNGFEVALPYYINIAENMDATLTPRILTNRGAMLAAEFRYLGKNFAGEIYADYLPSDKLLEKDRGFVDYKHEYRFNPNWLLNTRLKNVSDRNYFEDFGNDINTTSRSFIYSFLRVKGFGDNWRFKGQLNDYQIISDTISIRNQPYQTLPKLEYSWFNNNYQRSVNYGVDSQWVSFYRDESINSNRLDITTYLDKSFQNQYSRLIPRLAYRFTNWNYSDVPVNTAGLIGSRSLPIASLDYTINFEKQFEDGSYSSIEPRLFYLYAPFREQGNIPLFDTHNLTFGTGLLYQTNSFSGVDRQADANQISIGVSQRHFDASGNEKWNVTFGQIAYFEDRKVQLNNSIETRSISPIITEFNYFYRNWKATMSVHWDTEIDKSERALAKLQYKGNNKSVFNFAYRFRRGKIEQLDSSVVLPIGLNNRFIARWNYSVDDHKTIEAIAGFEYKNCCWAARIVGRRHVFNQEGDVNNGIYFELQFNGLGAIGRNPRRLLKQSILGYSEEF